MSGGSETSLFGGLDAATALAIERAAVAAWPSFQTERINGWLWRSSSGGSQRANSVSTLDYTGSDVEADIDEVEERYRLENAPSRIQVVADHSKPSDLDERLARRGYVIHDPVTALARTCRAGDIPQNVELSEAPTPGWMEVYLSNISPDRRPPAPGILDCVPRPRMFFGVNDGSRIVSTALGVIHGDVVIAECVGTWAAARGKGWASRTMHALETWGAANGARVVALHAVTANAPAQALYAALGYRKVGSSHYRFKGLGQ